MSEIELTRHRSALGEWTLARWAPGVRPEPTGRTGPPATGRASRNRTPRRRAEAAGLRGRVEGVWYFEGTMTLPRERHFPTGTLELIVQLGPPYRHVRDGRTAPFPTSCLTGLLLRPDLIEAPPEPASVLGIRLLPPGAWGLVGRPLHELTDRTVALADLLPGRAARLEDLVHAAPGPKARVRTALEWLRQELDPTFDPAVRRVLRDIHERGGRVRIAELHERSGLHRTTLTERFREQVGVTPKRFARLVRFRRALELLRKKELPLSGIALEAGYYDQSHLNHEFRELAGLSPGTYRRQVLFPESTSVAESAP